jgi:hypothetical protein
MTDTCSPIRRFHFAVNPYFSNEVLEKKFHLAPSGQPNAESSEINWKVSVSIIWTCGCCLLIAVLILSLSPRSRIDSRELRWQSD